MLDQHLMEPTRGIVRNHLQDYMKQPLMIGNNFIQITKILEKWVTLAESRNDLVQPAKRVPIKDAIIYFEYKKHLLSTSSNLTDDLIDPDNQNIQYKCQYENYRETFIDVQNALSIIWKTHSQNFSFKLEDDTLFIEFPGYFVSITNNQESGKTEISTNFVISSISNSISYTFLNSLSDTSKLLFSKSPESIVFNIDLSSLILYKKQLKLLVSFVQEDSMSESDVNVKMKIKSFIQEAKKGQILEIDYDKTEVNGIEFIRKFTINKFTKIRTIVRVTATAVPKNEDSKEIELVEYNKTYTKVSHQIDFHTDEMQKLYLANK